MHLPKLPTIFVKNGEERKAFFTVQARELLAAGWVEKEGEEILKKKVERTPEQKNPVARKIKAKKSETKKAPPKLKELIEGPTAEEPASEGADE